MDMQRWARVAITFACAGFLSACAGPESDDAERVGEAEQAEIDPGCFVLRAFANNVWTPIAYVQSVGGTGDVWKFTTAGASGLPNSVALELGQATQQQFDAFDAPAYDTAFSGWSDLKVGPSYPTGEGYTTFRGEYAGGSLGITFHVQSSAPVDTTWYNPAKGLVHVGTTAIRLRPTTDTRHNSNAYVGVDALTPQ